MKEKETIEKQKGNEVLPYVSERDAKIIYWAKQLEHKSLSLHELVENAKWLLDHVR